MGGGGGGIRILVTIKRQHLHHAALMKGIQEKGRSLSKPFHFLLSPARGRKVRLPMSRAFWGAADRLKGNAKERIRKTSAHKCHPGSDLLNRGLSALNYGRMINRIFIIKI